MDFTGTERYRVRRLLGSGAFGQVYEAFDCQHDELVALKVLSKLDPDALYRFKKEFRSLVNLSHPNLVKLHELASSGDLWFLSMELVDGVDFLAYVRGNCAEERETLDDLDPGSRETVPDMDCADGLTSFDEKRLRSSLRQLVEGVAALHVADKLHRDIKPHNVLVTVEGRVVLLDFGMVTDVAIDRSLEGQIVGTVGYMAPERATDTPETAATDWYSVGTMLYEALTGRLPFEGAPMEVLFKKMGGMPPPIEHLEPEVPKDLSDLCMRLLSPESGLRPTAEELLERLERVEVPVADLSAARSRRGRDLPFVGRESELAVLRDAFDLCRKGVSITTLLDGPSGVGKSALVSRLVDELTRERDAVTLCGRCYERESVPFKAMDSLVDALCRFLLTLVPADAEGLMPRDVWALARLFPVLGRVDVVAAAPGPAVEILPGQQEVQRRGFVALRELLSRIAERWPLLLVIDDLHWGDLDSSHLLTALLCPPHPPALMTVLCYRTEQAEHVPFLSDRRFLEGPSSRVIELTLAELDPGAARALAASALEREDGIDRAAVETVLREAGGNPFLLTQFASYLSSGVDVEEADLRAAVTLDQMIRAQTRGLSEDSLDLLNVVALAAQPLTIRSARQAMSTQGSFQDALGTLLSQRLLRSEGTHATDTLESYHERIRESVVASLPSEQRALIHGRLAKALAGAGDASDETLTVHFLESGQNERAAEHARRAATHADEAAAFDRAARLYRLALALGPYDDLAGDLQLKLAEALAKAGRGRESGEAYLVAATGADPDRQLELRRRAAEQFMISGHIEQGVAEVRGVLTTIGIAYPETPRRALLSTLSQRARLRLHGVRFHERSEDQIAPELLLRIDTCWSIGTALSVVDPIRGAYFQSLNLVLSLEAGEPRRIARALAMEVGYRAAEGMQSWPRTEALLQKALQLATQVGDPYTIGLANLAAGVAHTLSGQFSRGHRWLQSAEPLLRDRCTGVAWELGTLHHFTNETLRWLGDVPQLAQRVDPLLQDASKRGDLSAINDAAVVRQYLKMCADDPEGALREVEAAISRRPQEHIQLQDYWFLLIKVENYLYKGEGEAAWELVSGAWREIRRSLMLMVQITRIQLFHIRGRAALCCASQTDDARQREALLREARRCARTLARRRARLSTGLSELLNAGVASVHGDRRRALGHLVSADAVLQQAEATIFRLVAQRRRGELVGGEEGRVLVDEAEQMLRARLIAAPAKLTDAWIPGRWRDETT